MLHYVMMDSRFWTGTEWSHDPRRAFIFDNHESANHRRKLTNESRGNFVARIVSWEA